MPSAHGEASSDRLAVAPDGRIPVTLLTGYLGSGKTTVLGHLLKSPKLARTAVIINEFGEIGIDHDLVEAGSEKLVNLPGGCVCCSVRSDLADTLRGLFQRRVRGQVEEFGRVVIETTGLADPAPILQTLITDPLLSARFRLDGVVATVDAVNGWNTLNLEEEAVKQAAFADRLLLTKTDLAGRDAVAALTRRLPDLNPAAPISRIMDGVVDPVTLFGVGPIDRVAASEETHDHRHDDHIQSFSVTRDQPVTPAQLAHWLERLREIAGVGLLRVKGLVNVAERTGPTVIQGVQHIFSLPVELLVWPSEDRRTRVIFIGRNLDEQAIRDTLIE